jgi:hypothetical protein
MTVPLDTKHGYGTDSYWLGPRTAQLRTPETRANAHRLPRQQAVTFYLVELAVVAEVSYGIHLLIELSDSHFRRLSVPLLVSRLPELWEESRKVRRVL